MLCELIIECEFRSEPLTVLFFRRHSLAYVDMPSSEGSGDTFSVSVMA